MFQFIKTYFFVCLAVFVIACAVLACVKTVEERYPNSEKERKSMYTIIVCVVSLIISMFVYN